MTTVFTHIINGNIPGTFVYRDDQCVVFMSINPIANGHVLVVPVEEVDHWIDMSPELTTHMFEVSHKISQALATAFPCERVGLIIAGYEINHCHIHLIPTQSMRDLSFENAATSVERSDLEAHAQRIIEVL
jgi:diadenosine tetraphosphate (Ap4A) HIT family hydrolase